MQKPCLYPLIALLSIAPLLLAAQNEKTFHQAFEIQDASKIQFSLTGYYELVPWAGNTVLVETTIRLYDSKPEILDYFIKKEGRYNVLAEKKGEVLNLSSKDKVRKKIKYQEKECLESVDVRIFVPDTYEIQSDSLLVRKNDENK